MCLKSVTQLRYHIKLHCMPAAWTILRQMMSRFCQPLVPKHKARAAAGLAELFDTWCAGSQHTTLLHAPHGVKAIALTLLLSTNCNTPREFLARAHLVLEFGVSGCPPTFERSFVRSVKTCTKACHYCSAKQHLWGFWVPNGSCQVCFFVITSRA
jgi:hypothetical protein